MCEGIRGDQVLGKGKATFRCPFPVLPLLLLTQPGWEEPGLGACLPLSECLVSGGLPAGPLRAGCRPVGIPPACHQADRQLFNRVISSMGKALCTLPRIIMGEATQRMHLNLGAQWLRPASA